MSSAEEIIGEIEKNRAFYAKGGLTVSGGEPLLQIPFLCELFALARERGIHTAIDTSGATFDPDDTQQIDSLLALTDLVLLDIKHISTVRHRALTGIGNERILAFARHLSRRGVPVWIRHVVVQGYTDDEESLTALGRFLGTLSNVRALDVLPYHTLGREKYRALGITYPLDSIPPLSTEKAKEARAIILKGIAEERAQTKTN